MHDISDLNRGCRPTQNPLGVPSRLGWPESYHSVECVSCVHIYSLCTHLHSAYTLCVHTLCTSVQRAYVFPLRSSRYTELYSQKPLFAAMTSLVARAQTLDHTLAGPFKFRVIPHLHTHLPLSHSHSLYTHTRLSLSISLPSSISLHISPNPNLNPLRRCATHTRVPLSISLPPSISPNSKLNPPRRCATMTRRP